MVINNVITEEEAKQETDDLDGLMEMINLRRSMRYAMRSYIYYRRAELLAASLSHEEGNLLMYRTVLERTKEDYAIMAIRYEKMRDQYKSLGISSEEAKKMSKEDFIKQVTPTIKDIIKKTITDYSNEIAAKESVKSLSRVTELFDNLINRHVGIIEWNLRESRGLGIASFVQAIGESIELIANALED